MIESSESNRHGHHWQGQFVAVEILLASSRSAPKKDSKPDKSKGLANHMHVAAVDALNAFVQTDQPKGKDEERAAMKAVGPAVDVLLEAAPCDFMFCDDMS